MKSIMIKMTMTGLAIAFAATTAWAQNPADDTPAVVKDFEAKAAAAEPEAEPAPPPEKKTVTLAFTTVPRVKARVYYGKKLLGTTPFSVEWPRDSGPVDVVVRAHGFLRVNTRAYTFRDDNVSVTLTRPGSASRLLGYKAPIVEDEPEEGDGVEIGLGSEPVPGAKTKPGEAPVVAPTSQPVPGAKTKPVVPGAKTKPATP